MTRTRHALLALILLAPVPAACGDDDGGGEPEGDVVLLDDAADEVLEVLREAIGAGEVTVDDDVAAKLTAPADGAELSAATAAPTFTWTPRMSFLRHGVETGEFVLLTISCGGFDEPIDVLSVGAESWSVDAEHWDKLKAATGDCSTHVVSAYVDRGIVSEGPYAPSADPSFSIGQ